MKYIIFYISLFYTGAVFAQDSLVISSYQYANAQLIACKKSKDKLLFLDSLIIITNNGSDRPGGKITKTRLSSIQNEKLLIYYLNAGWICRLRGDYNQALSYFDSGHTYLESLEDDDLKGWIRAYSYYQQNTCYQAYLKDTTTYNKWDCVSLFPEWNEEPVTHSKSDSTVQKKLPFQANLDKFYVGDSLKVMTRFKSNSSGIKYFNQIKSNLLYEVQKNPVSQIFRETIRPQDRQDTVIIQVNLQNSVNTISKQLSIVYSSIKPFDSKHYLSIFSNIPFVNVPESVSFYIHIILKHESPNNYNKMEKVVISDGYFLIEYETPKPIETD